MSRRWIAPMLIIIVLIITTGQPAVVKAAQSPLVLLLNSDIWTWNGTNLRQMTHYGANFAPVLSPDGNHIAYLSVAQESLAFDNTITQAQHGLEDGINVYLLNVADDHAIRIAAQPADAAFDYNKLGYQKVTRRTSPTWSPDGKSVAWVEAVIGSLYRTKPSGSGQLVIYDLATKKTNILVSNIPLNADDVEYRLPDALWGPSGIALIGQTVMAGTNPYLMVYSVDGKLLSTSSTTDSEQIIDDAQWIQQNNQYKIAIRIYDFNSSLPAVWQMVDPMRDKSIAPLNGTLQIASANKPDGITAQLHSDGSWYVGQGNSRKAISTDENLRGIAISPDGTQLVYVVGNACGFPPTNVYLYNGSGAPRLISPDANAFVPGGTDILISPIGWGPLRWSVWDADVGDNSK